MSDRALMAETYTFLVLLVIVCATPPAAAQGIPAVTPIPTVTGPIPVTAYLWARGFSPVPGSNKNSSF